MRSLCAALVSCCWLGCEEPKPACTSSHECAPGQTCQAGECRKLCTSTLECSRGDCCAEGVCTQCGPPAVTAVEGTGSPDAVRGGWHLRDRMVVLGENLRGASATLSGVEPPAGPWPLTACAESPTRLELLVPSAVEQAVAGGMGKFALSVANQAGSCTTEVWLLQGEAAPWIISGSDMYFDAGNVGIGTMTPTAKLEVLGGRIGVDRDEGEPGVTLTGYGFLPHLHAMRANGTRAAPLATPIDAVLLRISAKGHTGVDFSTNAHARIQFHAAEDWTSTAHGTYMKFETTSPGATNIQERMRIDAGGNVGIGTGMPQTLLHLYQSGGPRLRLQNTGATNTEGALEFASASATRWVIGSDLDNLSGNRFMVYDATAAETRMLVDAAGNVGIGTTTPAATLDIDGFAKLKANAGEPAACNAGQAGALALTSAYRLCVCNGTGWFEVNVGAVCAW